MKCRVFKVSLEFSRPHGERSSWVFWSYHFNEKGAREAAIRWARARGGDTDITILSVDDQG